MHKIFYLPSTFGIYRKFYKNFASTNADNESFCTVLLASQVVMIQGLQSKGRGFESTCFFFYIYSIRLISFIIDVPRPLRNEILDHSISKDRCVTRKMRQSVRNIFRDSRENIVPYYSQNIRLKIIHYTCCLNLSSVGKRLKKNMRQALALRQSRYFFLNICDSTY